MVEREHGEPIAGFVDGHMHLWHRSNTGLRYAWMSPEHRSSAAGNKDLVASPTYDYAGYHAETRFAGVRKVVHIQAALGSDDPVLETAWVAAELGSAGVPFSQVVGAPLVSPALEPILARHLEHAGVVGVRDGLEGDWLTDPRVDRGLEILAAHDLSLEVGCAHPDTTALAALLDRHPRARFVLVHAGLPMERTPAYFEAWSQGLHLVAQRPNLFCKISGLGLWDPLWTPQSIRPWILECVAAFGPERCLFGSNWPIDRQFSSFDALVSAYSACIADFSRTEQATMMRHTAETVYRL